MRQGRRISKRQRRHHHQTTTNPTTNPSATSKHHNLAHKHIPKSTETQKSTQPKINKNPKINQTQNQLKLTGKPNPKTVHTHRKTQPNGVGSATPLLLLGLPLLPPNLPLLLSIGGGRRRVGCGGEREGESESESGGGGELGVSWIGWVSKLGVREGKREMGE